MPTGIYKRIKEITTETREKLRLANIGSNNPMYGKKTSKLQKEIASKVMKGNKFRVGFSSFNKGTNFSGMKGKKHSEETKLRMSQKAKERGFGKVSGKEHPRYTGSVKSRDIHSLFNPQYVEWRTSVFKRDEWKCKIKNIDCKGQLEAHHILPWRDYVELRYDINNGITLCHAHHPRKRAEEKRLVSYFMELVSVSKDQY